LHSAGRWCSAAALLAQTPVFMVVVPARRHGHETCFRPPAWRVHVADTGATTAVEEIRMSDSILVMTVIGFCALCWAYAGACAR
jgi:hypothetical protein